MDHLGVGFNGILGPFGPCACCFQIFMTACPFAPFPLQKLPRNYEQV